MVHRGRQGVFIENSAYRYLSFLLSANLSTAVPIDTAACKGDNENGKYHIFLDRMGSGSKGNPCWSIVWLLLLIFIAFYVAGFCAFIYIIISLFTPCIPPLYKVTDFLMKGVNFVNYCSNNMILMKPLF